MSNKNTAELFSKPVGEMTTKELEQLLKEKQQAERAEREEQRLTYENNRTSLIQELGLKAEVVSGALMELKNYSFMQLENFRELMLQYGDLKGGEKNKGNFEIKTDKFKIIYSSQVKKGFDERSELAEAKLKDFLATTVKKRDQKLHKLILSLLERNSKTGDLDISNIQRLYKMENDFDDANWKEAIQLFKESYNPQLTTRYIRFYVLNATNGWDLINLNFSSI